MSNVWEQLSAKTEALEHILKLIVDNEDISVEEVYDHVWAMKQNYLELAKQLKGNS